jgi:hypothetical protein
MGAEAVGHEGASQLGRVSGLMQTVVPGRRSTGCLSKCSRKVTWNELKMLPLTMSQRQYTLVCRV